MWSDFLLLVEHMIHVDSSCEKKYQCHHDIFLIPFATHFLTHWKLLPIVIMHVLPSEVILIFSSSLFCTSLVFSVSFGTVLCFDKKWWKREKEGLILKTELKGNKVLWFNETSSKNKFELELKPLKINHLISRFLLYLAAINRGIVWRWNHVERKSEVDLCLHFYLSPFSSSPERILYSKMGNANLKNGKR